MLRMYTIGVESAAASVLLLPAMWAVLESCRKNMTAVRRVMLMLMAVYLCGVCSATGLPTVERMHFAPRFNFTPMADFTKEPAAYLMNTFLNILLFVPFGFFVPLLWRKLRSALRTAGAGLCFSLFIETAQMFSGRLTDVEDLMVNTAGTLIGYWLAKFVYKKIAVRWQLHLQGQDSGIAGLVGMVTACVAVMYFVRPLAAHLFC